MKDSLLKLMISKIFLLFILITCITQIPVFSQTSVILAPPCPVSGCSASDVTIGSVFLADLNGTPIATCTAGDLLTGVYLWVNITKASSKKDLYLQFNLYKEGNKIDYNGNVYIGTDMISISVPGSITIGPLRMFQLPNYSCGEELRREDIYISWQTPGSTAGPGCAGQPGKCAGENLLPIDVNTPLAPDFTFTADCSTENGFHKIFFEDNTSGGDGVLEYLWNFGTGAIPATATTVGPHLVSYSSGGIKTISLTVTDEDGDSESISYQTTVLAALSVSGVITPLSCPDIKGEINITPTGGTENYLFD